MSVYSDIENALDKEEELYLRGLARKEAERDNKEPWDDEEEDEDEE